MSSEFLEQALMEALTAPEHQRQHGTMIPDQTGFTAAVPETHKRRVGMDTLQTVWIHDDNDDQSVPTFNHWIERNKLQRVFFMNEVDQEHRYAQVVRDLQAQEAKRHQALVDFRSYTKGELQVYDQMTPEAVEFSKNHINSVKRIKKARDKGEKHLKVTQSMYERGELLSQGDVPRFFTYISRAEMTPRQVQVQHQLESMSYYCGRRAGTYIFRVGSPSGDPVNGEQGTIVYCGLVPRNRADHVARLKKLRGRVLHILVATCSYVAGHAGAGSEQSVAEMHARMGQATDQDLETIFRDARIYLEQGCMADGVGEAFRKSSVLNEFVYLMVMHNVTPEEMKEGKRLVELICRVADLTEAELVGQEEIRLESTAWDFLFTSYNTSNFFIFHDDEVELNIHDYFSREEFAIDPNHPKAQYRITDEAWKKLESDYLFMRSLHQRWKKEHPDAAGLADQNVPKQFPLLASVFLSGQASDPPPTTDDPQPLSSRPATGPAEQQSPPIKRGRGRPKEPTPFDQLVMASPWSITRLFGRLSLLPATTSTLMPASPTTTTTLVRPFSSTSTSLARKAAPPTGAKSKASSSSTSKRKAKGKQAGLTESGRKVRTLKQNMFSPAPPPLRMGRQRHLRHWTIHRAWQLFRRQQHEAQHKERSRMQAGMWNACEALRIVQGPGDRDEGYLYRVAMDKEGLWDGHAIPIEYARMQTETPAVEAWNHEWKR